MRTNVSPQRFLQTRRAFTLIELLVVIAIIGVLAALTMPAIASAKKSSQATVCASNLKAIGTAVFTYVADHDGVLPTEIDSTTGQNKLIAQVLWPYVYKSTKYVGYTGSAAPAILKKTIFECPSMYDDKALIGPYLVNYRSYGWNYYLGDGASLTQDRLVALPTPSTTALMADNFNYSQLYPQSDSVAPRHNGKCNVLYGDGHVTPINVTASILNYNFKDPFWGKNF